MAGGMDVPWFSEYRESFERVLAACTAVGEATAYLNPANRWTDGERLVHLRTVVCELNRALGMPPLDSLDDPNTETNTDTNTNAGNGGEVH